MSGYVCRDRIATNSRFSPYRLIVIIKMDSHTTESVNGRKQVLKQHN